MNGTQGPVSVSVVTTQVKWGTGACLDRDSGSPQSREHQELQAFLSLLEHSLLQEFLSKDPCFQISDKYLLAMVLVYFRRAQLQLIEYNPGNLFLALFLANDMEEDASDPKCVIFPLGPGPGLAEPGVGFSSPEGPAMGTHGLPGRCEPPELRGGYCRRAFALGLGSNTVAPPWGCSEGLPSSLHPPAPGPRTVTTPLCSLWQSSWPQSLLPACPALCSHRLRVLDADIGPLLAQCTLPDLPAADWQCCLHHCPSLPAACTIQTS